MPAARQALFWQSSGCTIGILIMKIFPRTNVQYFLAIFAAFLGWLACVNLAVLPSGSCIQTLPDPKECEARDIIQRYPYCVLDPVCVSPVYQASSDNVSPTWQGVATNMRDPALGGHNSYEQLAVLNLAMFGLAVGLAGFIISLLSVSVDTRRAIALALFAWCLLECGRWAWTIYSVTREYSWITDSFTPASFLAFALSLLPSILSLRWALRVGIRRS
jgi:hypothetical protein